MEADKDLQKELDSYPTSFDVIKTTCIGKMTRKYLSLKLDQSIKDLDILSTKMEQCRTHNLISFLHFLIGDIEKAFEANTKTLELDPNNIIALSNHAQFLYEQEMHFGTVKDTCEKLSELSKDPYKMVIAKAELAYSYTRFGSRFCKVARTLFQSVLSACKELAGNTEVSKENICIWLFGCSLTYKRLLNIVNVHETSDIDLSKQNYISVCELYRDIISMETHSDVCKLYSARAYLLLGEISYDIKLKDIFPNKLLDILPDSKELHMSVEDYFQKALSLNKDDVFVLERYGKHYRYTGQMSKSIELLKKAIEIKPTSLNHHHLAITLKRQLEGKSQQGHQRDNATRQLFPKRPTNEQHSMSEADQNKEYARHTSCTMTQRNDGEVFGRLADQFASVSISTPTENVSGAASSSSRQQQPAYPTGKFTYSYNEHVRGRRGNGRAQSQYGGKGQSYHSHDIGRSYERCFSAPNATYQRSYQDGRGRKGMSSHRGKFTKGYSDPNDVERAIYQRCIKSPRKCKYINMFGNEEEIKAIEFNLRTSFDIGMNASAMYEMGLLYRQLNQIDKALDIFRKLIRSEYGQCTLVLLANSYEQAGLCIDDLLSNSPSDNPRRDEEDMKMYFKKSIEITCNLVAKNPLLDKCWTSAPTLMSFLNRQSKTKHVLKDLKFLYQKINDYGNAVNVLRELSQLVDDDAEKTEVVEDIIKTHIQMKNFDDAVLGFELIKCLPNWQERVSKELYVTVHVEGAFDAFKKDHNKVASLRFENAFDFCKSLLNEEPLDATREDGDDNDDSEGTQYDIFILSDPENELNGMKLRDVLVTLGLKTTLNSEDVPLGKLALEGIGDIMNMSKHFIVIYDILSSEKRAASSKKMMFYFASLTGIVIERNHGNVIIMVSTNIQPVDVPKIFSGWKKEHFNFDTMFDAKIEDYSSFKPLLTGLAMGSDGASNC